MNQFVTKVVLEPIGWVSCSRVEPIDDDWDTIDTTIVLDENRYSPDSLKGLESFSHLEVIYFFHLVSPDSLVTGARHPRDRQDWPQMGIFAQRVKNRPNRLGLATCKILEVSGCKISVQGLDAINQTPVLDIKPVMSGFLPRGEIREPDWAREIMADYWS